MIKKDTINWGIIGVGDVTEVKSGPAFYKAANSNLHAVMRRNAEKAADYAKRHKVPKWYSNGSDLINDPLVDAVYVATPPDSHATYAIEAMRAGKPVYVEKPMARNYDECMEMIRVSEETGMPLFVAYYRRTLPAFLKVKELIEAGEIGQVLSVEIVLHKKAQERNQLPEEMHWHVNPEIGGAGHFFDLASHQFDFLDFVLDEIEHVHGEASNRAGLYRAEDTVTAAFQFKSGVIGSGNWCFVVEESEEKDRISFFGEHGTISIPCFSLGPVEINSNKGNKSLEFQNPQHISQNLVQQVNDDLLGKNKCISTMYSAARTSKVLDEIVKGYYK